MSATNEVFIEPFLLCFMEIDRRIQTYSPTIDVRCSIGHSSNRYGTVMAIHSTPLVVNACLGVRTVSAAASNLFTALHQRSSEIR